MKTKQHILRAFCRWLNNRRNEEAALGRHWHIDDPMIARSILTYQIPFYNLYIIRVKELNFVHKSDVDEMLVHLSKR